jgi:hypothetical protein
MMDGDIRYLKNNYQLYSSVGTHSILSLANQTIPIFSHAPGAQPRRCGDPGHDRE